MSVQIRSGLYRLCVGGIHFVNLCSAIYSVHVFFICKYSLPAHSEKFVVCLKNVKFYYFGPFSRMHL